VEDEVYAEASQQGGGVARGVRAGGTHVWGDEPWDGCGLRGSWRVVPRMLGWLGWTFPLVFFGNALFACFVDFEY
jgi:hypothetical protein